MENDCVRCERLVKYRTSIQPKKSLAGRNYWNRPVPNFGDPNAWLLIIGLAPGAHGANRTGRPFQGDAAGELLYGALYEVGLCNMQEVVDYDPSIALFGVLVTNAVRCAPPGNKPNSSEFINCRKYLQETLALPTISHILCIGKDAYEQLCKASQVQSHKFSHGLSHRCGKYQVYCSYHTSAYNQNTNRITKGSLVGILRGILSSR
jgi:uracil-DNA glycosylase